MTQPHRDRTHAVPAARHRAARIALALLAAALAGSLACSGAPAATQATTAPAGAATQPPASAPSAAPARTTTAAPASSKPAATGQRTATRVPTAAKPTTPKPTATQPAAQPTASPARQSQASGFAGTWDSEWGVVTLTVSGSRVSGTYESNGGKIEGTLSADGRTMEGTWSEAPTYAAPEQAGRVVFALSDDGNSLEGQWWFGEDEEGGEWLCTRTGAAPAGEPGGKETPRAGTASPGLTLSSDPENDLLFYVTAADGSHVYYYGTEPNGAMQLTHIIVDDGAGGQDLVIFDGRFLPLQWVLPTKTVAVYPVPDDEGKAPPDGSWFDPQKAFHVIREDKNESTLTADIRPGDLGALLDEMEAATGRRFEGARGFLAQHHVTFDELIELARLGSPDQPLYIAAAAGFSSAAAALRLEQAGGTASSGRAPGLAAPQAVIFGDVVKVGAGALGGALADALGQSLDPGNGPSVGVLLCRGAAKYGVCHYMFYRSNRLGACIANCYVTLGCFTDICMPMDISADLAMGLGGAMAGR